MNGTRNDNRRPQRRGGPGDRKGGPPPSRPAHRQVSSRRDNNASVSAQKHYDRYMALARDAASSGDLVEMENCFQHAEHYFRVMKERMA
jgi:hypothetical protein